MSDGKQNLCTYSFYPFCIVSTDCATSSMQKSVETLILFNKNIIESNMYNYLPSIFLKWMARGQSGQSGPSVTRHAAQPSGSDHVPARTQNQEVWARSVPVPQANQKPAAYRRVEVRNEPNLDFISSFGLDFLSLFYSFVLFLSFEGKVSCLFHIKLPL